MQANRPRLLMPTETYNLPNFLASLPKKPGGGINLHFKEVEAAFNAWVEMKLGGPSAVEVYQADSPLFVSLTFPLASYEQLRGIVDFAAAGFLLDDIVDHRPSEDFVVLSQLWTETLRDGGKAKGVHQHPLIEMMRSELIPSTKATVGSFHWPQFVGENEKLLMQMVQEAHDRKASMNKNMTLDIQSYLIDRRLSVGAFVYFVFVRATHSLYISDDVLASPVAQKMQDAAADALIISNDIHSFKKEYRIDGALSNILTAIENDPETAHLDFQGRLEHAEKLFKGALERFYACRRELPSFGPEMDGYLALYADGLLDVIAGNLQWSRVVRRYNTFMHDEDRRNNLVRLALGDSSANENGVSVC